MATGLAGRRGRNLRRRMQIDGLVGGSAWLGDTLRRRRGASFHETITLVHLLTLVIIPGPRSAAYKRADQLLHRVAPKSVDFWMIGGRAAGLLQRLDLVDASDPWPDAIELDRIPRPAPDDLVPVIFVTPRGGWLRGPLSRGGDVDKEAAWESRVNRLLDTYRDEHVAVVVDAHW